MKPLLIGIISVVVFAASYSQTVQSDCSAPDSVAYYAEDAAWLAYQHLVRVDTSYRDSISISQSLQDTFLRSINALYNAVLSAKDTFSIVASRLHGFRFSLDRLRLFIDTTIPWVNRFINREYPTGNSTIDSLIEVFGIIVDTVYRYGWSSVDVIIRTKQFYNMEALRKLFEPAVPSFLISFLTHAGDGSNVEGGKTDTIVTLIYSRGWGDCLSGCLSRRFWQFTVFPDCSVRFDSSFGDILPPEELAVSRKPAMQGLFVMPNPASDELKIFSDEDGIIEIVDLNGRAILRQEIRAPQQEISIKSLPLGMYVIRMTSKLGMLQSIRFIKQ